MAQNPAMARVCSECDYEFPPHARKANEQASKLQVISTKPKVEPIEQRIDEVRWSDHTSKNSGKRMLRVDYFGPGSSSQWHPVATDWVCIEHDGYARQKAEEWWAVHLAGRGPCPSTVDAAMRMEEWKRPVEAIWTVPDGKYQKITKYRFGRMRQPGEDDDEPEDGQQEQTEQPTDGGWDDDDFLPF
jgi:DNA repair protein RadD